MKVISVVIISLLSIFLSGGILFMVFWQKKILEEEKRKEASNPFEIKEIEDMPPDYTQ